MFCPECGRDNLEGVSYCANCGTNLAIISRALYSSRTGLFRRAENRLNHFIARYTERVFRNSTTLALSGKLSDSWKVLGEGVVTLAVDFLLFWLMLFVVLPVKLLSLLLFSPIRLLLDRGGRQKLPIRDITANVAGRIESPRIEFQPGDVVSAVEHTTEHLAEYQAKKQRQRANDHE